MDLASFGEFGLIDMIQIPNYAPEQVILGIGDDCAVLPFNDTQYQLVSCDLLVEDVHFIRRRISARQLGYKAVAVNLSDVAAMGGTPVHVLLSVALPPDYTVEEWQQLYQGVQEICKKYGVNVIGGDTTSGQKLTINVTVMGLVQKEHLHLRSDAKPGDVIFVTGPLGGSRAGLELVLDNAVSEMSLSAADRQHLWQCHCQPEPCCKEIAILNQLAGTSLHALNDISDGLLSECAEIAEASNAALILRQETIPVDDSCQRLAKQCKLDGLQWAMTGGEDYQLVGTLAADCAAEISRQYQQQTGKPLFLIGTVEAGSGVLLEQHGQRCVVQETGYNHFAKKENTKQEDAKQEDTNIAAENSSASESAEACTRLLQQQLADLEQQEEQQRVYRHDLQNHLACLSGLLECGHLEEARAYLQQMMQSIPQKTAKTYSQRTVLNSLLNQKEKQAQEKNMDVQFQYEEGLLDFMTDYDLCTLLGNLLDNGLEHSEGEQEAYLYLDIFSRADGSVVVQLENSCERRPVLQNGRLHTQKADKRCHGKGMAQIQRVTAHYGGQFQWSYEETNKRFITKCVFSMIS